MFLDVQGAAGISYAGLVVRDCRGQTLPSRMEASDGVIRLEISATDENYPLTIDPIIEPVLLLGSGQFPFHGPSVCISQDTIVVGSFLESSACSGVNCDPALTGTSAGSGAAFVFTRQANGWVLDAYLKASNPDPEDRFGSAVAISGDTIVVGAPNEDSGSFGINGNQLDNSASLSGAAYVFVRSAGTWTQQAYLKASNVSPSAFFGRALDVSGDAVVVGAIGDRSNATGVNGNQLDTSMAGSGAAYVFERSGTTWTQTAYLKASNTDAGDHFGESVAVDSDGIVVGAPLERSAATGVNGNGADNSSSNAGAAYVFARTAGQWTGPVYLKASNSAPSAQFGQSVDIHGGLIVAGAPGHGVSQGMLAAGAAYVFEHATGVWSEQAALMAGYAQAFFQFGYSVAIDGNRALVGSPYDGVNATGIDGTPQGPQVSNAGAAYEFARMGNAWSQVHYIKSTINQSGGQFGKNVSLSQDAGVVLAAGETLPPGNWGGGVHVIDFDTTTTTVCPGDGSAGTCPCGNAGATGHGCANSVDVQGSRLVGSGVARLAFESLQLTATGLGGGAGMFVQGTGAQAGGAGIPFGDGLLCAGGAIRRLAIQFPTNGAATYPAQLQTDPRLSVLGSVSAGTTLYYQFWHRDSAPYCTPSTFNLTNGLAIPWGL